MIDSMGNSSLGVHAPCYQHTAWSYGSGGAGTELLTDLHQRQACLSAHAHRCSTAMAPESPQLLCATIPVGSGSAAAARVAAGRHRGWRTRKVLREHMADAAETDAHRGRELPARCAAPAMAGSGQIASAMCIVTRHDGVRHSAMQVGPVKVGSEHKIALQTMTTTDTRDVEGTVDQVQRLSGVTLCDPR